MVPTRAILHPAYLLRSPAQKRDTWRDLVAIKRRLDEVGDVLAAYSENLGIAYQIRDDMDDLGEDAGDNELEQMRPSVLLAVARERARGDDKALLESLWNHEDLEDIAIHKIRKLAHEVEADEKCMLLLETYKEAAVRSLAELENPNLKGLLRRVMGKIFNDLEIKGWCREFEVKNGVREDDVEKAEVS